MEPIGIVGKSDMEEKQLDYLSESLAPDQIWSNYLPQKPVRAHAHDFMEGIKQQEA